jgi:predicted ATPase
VTADPTPFIERLKLTNYKSIGECDVTFRPLTVIVGRNGSGKSNFLDSLHFVSDALRNGLDAAIRGRGGAKAITHKRRGPGLQIELSFRCGSDACGRFLLELDRGLVRREELTLEDAGGVPLASYHRFAKNLSVQTREGDLQTPPAVLHDRLALVTLSGTPAFREAFDTLSSMRFYRFNPEAMRTLQDPDDGEVLQADGANVASVWRRLVKEKPALTDRLTEYLKVIAPEIQTIRPVMLGLKETLNFYQETAGRRLMFHASDMSDGTLRALGALVASRQANGGSAGATLVGIEEPENSIHPAAVAVLVDAFSEASLRTQVVVTSHSADILDYLDNDRDALLVTEMRDGNTTVAGMDNVGREAIRRHLYTAGELLRMNQLQPQEELVPR